MMQMVSGDCLRRFLHWLNTDVRCRALAPWFAVTLFASSCVLFLVRIWQGLWFIPFADESEHLLGGKVLNAGGRLYVTYIDSHGPVIFMLTQLYGATFGWAAPNYARLIEPGVAILAAWSVASSPALGDRTEKAWGIALFFGLLATVWLVQGLYLLNFYPVAGMLAAIGIAGFLAGSWSKRIVPSSTCVVAGVSFSLLFFTAYSFGPSVALFAFSGCWAAFFSGQRRKAFLFMLGLAIGAFGTLIWLIIYSDPMSYLAFHIAFNQTAYAPFTGATPGNFIRSLVPSFDSAALAQTVALLSCGLSCLLFLVMDFCAGDRSRHQTLPILTGHAGILLLNARGLAIFQNGTFLIASVCAVSVAISTALARLGITKHAALSMAASLFLGVFVASVELIGRHALSSPSGLTRKEMVMQPRFKIGRRVNQALFDRVRAIARPDERVLALVYWPDFYFAVDRLPIDGYYEYLPWDAAYAKSPWFGRRRDICLDLARSPPPIIAFDNWKVWGLYAPADYMPCVLQILADQYRQLPEDPRIYVRLDRTSGGK